MKINKLFFILLFILISLSISAASASDLNINQTDSISITGSDNLDAGINEVYVDIHGSDSNSGNSQDSAIQTIKNAVSIADENATIHLSDGEYKGLSNTRITIDKSLNFIGSKDTVINGANANYIFDIDDGVSVTFKNIRFVNAYKSPESYSVSYNQKVYGAALDIKNASVKIDNCTFENNVLSYGSMDNYIYGGAISNFGDLTIANSKLINNTALSTSGLFSYGGSLYNKGKLSISNTSFLRSKSIDFGYGAAIANDGEVIMENSLISDSIALHECKGSAIYNTGDFKLYNSIIENNYIERASFNFIYGVVYNSGTLTARGSIFRNNTGYYEAPIPAYKGSGNIYNIGHLNLSYNAFIDNAPFDGISRDIYFNGGEIITIDNNWWNTNENPYLDDYRINVDEINSWLILNLTPQYSKLNVSDSVTINAKWTNNINLLPQANSIPVFDITFKTSQNTSTKKLANGQADFIFNYTQNKGSYDVIASLGSFSQSVLVDVGKVETYVKFNVSDNITYLDDLLVDVEVAGKDNNIPTGFVLLKINGETYSVDLVNGKGRYSISDLTPNKYDLEIVYDGNENYFKAFNRTNVVVNKQDVDLAIYLPEIKVSQSGKAIVELAPKGVQGQAILYVDGVRKKIVYLYNGNTTISLNNFAEGQYNISIVFVETDFYNSASVSGILNVTRYESAINISAEDIKVGENATITLKVSPSSLRGEATLIINGVNNTIFIDDDITNVTLTNLKAGNYNVTLIFDGDLRYNPVRVNTSFKVLRTPVALDVDIKQDDKNLNGTITLTLNSTEITGVVGLYVNYNSYTANLSNGKATFNVKFDKGTNYIFAYYEGNDLFEDASWNTTLGVADEFVFIGENSTGYEYNNFNYSVRLIEINGIAMPGRVVSVEFNGVKYNITTNNDGFAYFNLNLASGTYTIKATYKNQTITNILTVKKVDFNLTSNNITYGEDEIIKAVFDSKVSGNVTFEIENTLNVSVEIINGTASYTISTLNAGTYLIKATYLNITHTNQITVGKANIDLNVNVEPATPYIDEIVKVTDLNNASGEIIFTFNDNEYHIPIADSQAILNLSKLNEGNYSLTITYAGDNNYFGADKTISFYVKQFASDLILTINDGVYAQDLIAIVKLNDDATGTVRFNVGNITKDIAISKGSAIWNFTGLDAGNYNITATYLGNDYYVESQNETSFNVFKANSTIELYVKEVSLGENIRIYANLSPNATGSVSFSMIGYFSPRNKPVSNSASTWYIAPMNTGEYSVIARYLGDNNYYPSNTTFTLNVNQHKSILNVELNDVGLSDRINCKVSLNSKEGEPITSTVRLTIGNTNYYIDVVEGTGSLVIGRMPVGNYAYTVSYDGDENFTSASYSGNFKVVDDLLDVNLTVSDLTKYYGGKDKLQILLKNSNNNPFANQVVIVKIASKEYRLVTNSKGIATLDVNLNPGVYTVDVVFEETSRYNRASANATLEVLPTVEGIDVVKIYGSGTQYFAAFLDANGKALGNTKVTFTISGNSYTLTTLPNGVARVNVNFKVGNYVISTVNPVTGQKLSNKITIFAPIMENKDSSNYYGAKTNYKVRIYGSNAKPVGAGKVVSFKVNGKTYKVKTDKNGYAKLAVKLNIKTYTVTATYSGYKVSNKIKVKPLLSAKDMNKKKAKTTRFSAKLVNSKGKIAVGKKVTFKVNGKKYTAKTNSKGVAIVKLNLGVGTHKIQSIYGKSKITNKIVIRN